MIKNLLIFCLALIWISIFIPIVLLFWFVDSFRIFWGRQEPGVKQFWVTLAIVLGLYAGVMSYGPEKLDTQFMAHTDSLYYSIMFQATQFSSFIKYYWDNFTFGALVFMGLGFLLGIGYIKLWQRNRRLSKRIAAAERRFLDEHKKGVGDNYNIDASDNLDDDTGQREERGQGEDRKAGEERA